MADLIFIQRSWTGRRIFQLRGDVLTISGSVLGVSGNQVIPLRTINPDYQRHATRFGLLIVAPLILCGLSLAAGTAILLYLPMAYMLSIYAVIFFIAGAVAALRGVARTDFLVFLDQWDRPLFSMVRDEKQKATFDAFVFALLDRIERLDENVPPAADPSHGPAQDGGIALSRPDHPSARAEMSSYWRISLIAGALSSLFPGVVKIFPNLADLVLPVLLLASTGGLYWGITSLVTKEPRPLWAVLGMVLSLVGPVVILSLTALPFF